VSLVISVTFIKQENRQKRHKRVRSKINGTSKVPRLCVFRSNKHIYAQLIDDEKGNILVSASDLDINIKSKIKDKKPKTQIKDKKTEKTQKDLTGKTLIAYYVGQILAGKAVGKKIEKAVFDRAGYKYHGRIKSLAEGAKKEGLKF